MPVKAYVLIETSVGKARDVVKALQGVPHVTGADMVTGPHDVIVVVEADTLDAVGEIVTRRIHPVPGVTRTLTCLAVKM